MTDHKYDVLKLKHRTALRLLISGFISVLVVVGVFFAVILLFPLSSFLPTTIMSGHILRFINWNLLEGLVSVAALSLVLGGLVFAIAEYTQTAIQQGRENAEASFNIYTEIFDRLMSPEAMAARRWVLINIPAPDLTTNDQAEWLKCTRRALDECPSGWTRERPPGREHLKCFLNTLDFIGFTAKYYWNLDNELVQWLSPSISKVWERVELYVEFEAKQRNEEDFYLAAREFGHRCVEWRRDRFPDPRIIEEAT